MNQPSPHKTPKAAARFITKSEAATILNMSVTTLNERLRDMYADGCPMWDELIKGFDLKAFNLWLDARAGLVPPSESDADRALNEWRVSRAS